MPSASELLHKPLIPEEPVRKLQEQIDPRSLEQSPWVARLRGFGAGALEGLRNLSSPAQLANIASVAIPMMGAYRAPKAVQGLAEAISDAAPAAQTLGELLPEYTPRGGEALYNIGRQMTPRTSSPLAESAFTRYVNKPWK